MPGHGRQLEWFFADAGVMLPLHDSGMLPETEVNRLHRAVCLWLPERASDVLRQAELATGDSILTHRIAGFLQRIIRLMPVRLAARVLAKATAISA